MPDVRVRLLAPDKKTGVGRAQILVGQKALAAVALSEFSDEMQRALATRPEVVCEPSSNPTPQTVRPAPVQPGVAAPTRSEPAPHRPSGPGSAPVGQRPSGPSARPSVFAENPYNFAQWVGAAPWGLEPPDRHAGATHDAWHADRLSGTLAIDLTARTPVFVPQGDFLESDDRSPRRFWRCADRNGAERFGIPGSSIKGVLRSAFEAWTNSRVGILSPDNYDHPIAYRRRAADVWVIDGPVPGGGLRVIRCRSAFAKREGDRWNYGDRPRGNFMPPDPVIVSEVDPANTSTAQARVLRANLLWTPDHRHRNWTHVVVHVTKETAVVPEEVLRRYLHYLGGGARPGSGSVNPALENHLDRVQDLTAGATPGAGRLGTNYYASIPNERRLFADRIRDLRRLDRGSLLFALRDPARPDEIACFGKNVNFMWPAERSPRDLVGRFYENESTRALASADHAEATFGFSGGYGDGGHPFRGRARVGVFWADESAREMPAVALGPLTSPTGIKLKARPLYLPPDASGRSSDYDEAEALRGRKFYWHQRARDGGVAESHVATQPSPQNPSPIHPLPEGTVFRGIMHFDNLTKAELGALLACIRPALLFDDGRRYGIKVGKAKPRGLGSLEATVLTLRVRRPVSDAYRSLADSPLDEPDEQRPGDMVAVFRRWLEAQPGGQPWSDLPFVRDLRALLRLPESESVRQYRGEPGDYNWMPGFNDPFGNPTGGRDARPIAMPLARDQQMLP